MLKGISSLGWLGIAITIAGIALGLISQGQVWLTDNLTTIHEIGTRAFISGIVYAVVAFPVILYVLYLILKENFGKSRAKPTDENLVKELLIISIEKADLSKYKNTLEKTAENIAKAYKKIQDIIARLNILSFWKPQIIRR